MKYLWINRVETSLIVEFVKFNKFFIHVNVRTLEIWEYLSCVNWSSKNKTLILYCIFNVFNQPVKCFDIFFKVLKSWFRDFHFLENLLWFSCVLILHLTSYESRYDQSLIDVNDVKRKVDCSWHSFENRLFFTIELRKNDDFIHDGNKSLVFDVEMIQNVVNCIKLILN